MSTLIRMDLKTAFSNLSSRENIFEKLDKNFVSVWTEGQYIKKKIRFLTLNLSGLMWTYPGFHENFQETIPAVHRF